MFSSVLQLYRNNINNTPISKEIGVSKVVLIRALREEGLVSIVVFPEEPPTPLAADLGENRGIVRVGGERGNLRTTRPAACCAGLHKLSFPLVRRIVVVMLVMRWCPFDAEGDAARNWCTAGHSVDKVVIVRHGQVLRLIDGVPIARIHPDALGVERHCPEPSVTGDARVEVMDLTRLVKDV